MSRIFGPFSALYDPQKHFQSFLKNLTRPEEFKFLLALCILQFTTRFCFCCDLYFAEVWVVRREGCNLIFFDKRTWHPDFGENFTPKPSILNLFHFSHFFFWFKHWVSMWTMKCEKGWWGWGSLETFRRYTILNNKTFQPQSKNAEKNPSVPLYRASIQRDFRHGHQIFDKVKARKQKQCIVLYFSSMAQNVQCK